MSHPSHWDTIKGLFGLGATVFAQLTANMQTLEWGLRMLSLTVGICVGIATLWSIIRNARKPRRRR